jgi:hypothetical protein
MASRQMLISRIRVVGLITPPSPSSRPCQAWHGYTVTIATHHEEVEVRVDGHASAPPSRGAAVAPGASNPACKDMLILLHSNLHSYVLMKTIVRIA